MDILEVIVRLILLAVIAAIGFGTYALLTTPENRRDR